MLLRYTGMSNGGLVYDEHVILLAEYAPLEEYLPSQFWTCAAYRVFDGQREYVAPASWFEPFRGRCRCDVCDIHESELSRDEGGHSGDGPQRQNLACFV